MNASLNTAQAALTAAMLKAGFEPATLEAYTEHGEYSDYSGWLVRGEHSERAATWLVFWCRKHGVEMVNEAPQCRLISVPYRSQTKDGHMVVLHRYYIGD